MLRFVLNMRIAPKPAGSKTALVTSGIVSIVELLLITLGYFAVVWLIAPRLETNGMIPFMKVLLVSFVFYFSFLSPDLLHQDALAQRGLGSWRTLFIRFDNLLGSCKYYLGLTLAGGTLMVGTAFILKPGVFSGFSWHALWLKMGLNILNALGQDLLFLAFFMPRIRELCSIAAVPGPFAGLCSKHHAWVVSLVCALLFAIYHMPNPPLMLLVFGIGWVVSYIYYHAPNLVLAVLTHAILGTILHRVLELNTRIGPFFWERDKYVYRTLFPALKELIGNAF
jgi:membrane protease YdiL (CAAX protease family)